MATIFYPFLSLALAFLVCIIIIPIIIKLAQRYGYVVQPRKDRWHTKPTALLGGIGIVIASIAGFMIDFENIDFILIAAMLTMFLTGLIDDLKEVKPIIKLIGQIICTFALIYRGYYFGFGFLGWFSVPITFFWVIGITNAVNLLDNMDGLATGISAIISLVSGTIFFFNDNHSLSVLSYSIAGASIGFLIYNFNPAKIFMGDCGSLFLGFSLSFFSLAIQKNVSSSSAIFIPLIPIFLMAIPIMDTTLVTVKRIFAGRRIDQGGKDHSSHRLVALGLSEKKAVLILYLICFFWGVVCVVSYQLDIFVLVPLFVLLGIFSVIFAFLLSNVRVYDESEEKLAYLRVRGKEIKNIFLLRLLLQHKKILLGLCVDILIISSSFWLSLILTNTLVEEYYVMAVFIAIKILVFYLFDLYKRIWRYAAASELLHYLFATIISVLIISGFLYIFLSQHILTLQLFAYDIFFTVTGTISVRIFYKILKEVLFKFRSATTKIIVYGAGEAGYLLIKELSNNQNYRYKPIGWIDDDSDKKSMIFYGYKVLGTIYDLDAILKMTEVDIIVISTKLISSEKWEKLNKVAKLKNIKLAKFSVNLDFV